MSREQHLDVSRLIDLSREAIIVDDIEVRHLKSCEECQTLLRIFVRQVHADRLESESKTYPRKSA